MPKKIKATKITKAEQVEISRTFSRKLNMSAHGGKQYETADISCTVSTKTSDPKKTSLALDVFCRKQVQETIDLLDKEVLEVEETPMPSPKKKKKVLDLGVKVEQDELSEISDLVNELTLAKTTSDLQAAVLKIKKRAEELNKTQKDYLSAYYLKRKAAMIESE